MILTKTPLRISLVGGGSDLPSYYTQENVKFGMVVSAAINKYIYIIVKKRLDDLIYIKYAKNEVVKISEIGNIENELIRETLKFFDIKFGVEIINFSDIPIEKGGFGLGGSSSFIVGLLHALYLLKGMDVSKCALAEKAAQIEIKFCKRPIGKQDQYAAACGGINSFRFYEDEYVEVTRFNFEKARRLNDYLLMFYTGIHRDASVILKEQKEKTEQGSIIEQMNENVQLALKGEDLLKEQRFSEVGYLIDTNWQLKKRFANKMTNNEIEELRDVIMWSGGNGTGAKICGSGGGGFLLVAVDDPVKTNRIKKDVKEKFNDKFKSMDFKFDEFGTRTLLNVEEELSW